MLTHVESIKDAIEDVEFAVAAKFGTVTQKPGYLALFLLTGPAGAGKSFTAERLFSRFSAFETIVHIDLDAISELGEFGWVCSLEKLRDELIHGIQCYEERGQYVVIIVSGTCDNMEEVISYLSNEVPAERKVALLIRPQVRMYKFNMALKAKDLPFGHSFKTHFLALASRPESELRDYLLDVHAEYVSYFRHSDFRVKVLENNRIPALHSGLGWHKFTSKLRTISLEEVVDFLRVLKAVRSL